MWLNKAVTKIRQLSDNYPVVLNYLPRIFMTVNCGEPLKQAPIQKVPESNVVLHNPGQFVQAGQSW